MGSVVWFNRVAQAEYECELCRERGKTWEGDDPKCAFRKWVFDSDNWNCATMNELREIAYRLETTWRDDMASGSIGYVPFEVGDDAGYIVMTWYKDEGQTGQALVMRDDEEPKPLTADLAVKVVQQYAHLLKR